MNKGLAIGIIILLAVIGFGVYQVSIKNPSKGNQTSTQRGIGEPPKSDSAAEESNSPSSLRELFASGQSQRCAFSSLTEDTRTDGTMYVSNGKMRGDISTVTSGKTIMSHMIASENELFVWMDGETNGMKMTFDPNEIQDGETKQKTVDLDEKVDYQCSGWTGDSSLFDAPPSVTFTNLDSIAIPTTVVPIGGSEGVTGGNESACAACDSLSGDVLTQCKTALGCK